MLVFSVILWLGCIFAPVQGKPRYYNEVITDEGDNFEEGLVDRGESILYDQIKFPALPKNGELFEGDIVMDDRLRRAVWGQEEKKSAIRGLKGAGLMWPNGIINYEIDPNFSPHHLKMLHHAMSEFEKRTCIRFRKRTNEKNYVHYTEGKDECSSNIGMSGGRQNITLGKHCGVLGTFEHETMHALGFIHEHSRPDRDDYIKVNFKNIKKSDLVNFQKYKMDQVTNLKEEFNFASIMLYRNDAFSKNGEDTLQAITEPDLNFGQRLKFSAGDVKEVNHLYNCKHYLDHPNYHHLFKEYHTKRRKRKKDNKYISKRRMMEFLLSMKDRLRAENNVGYYY